jgi:flotillin
MVKSIPPLHDVASMAGVDLPDYLGKIHENAPSKTPAPKPAASAEKTAKKS